MEELARSEGWGGNVTHAILLSVEELLTNVVNHGGPAAGTAEMEIKVTTGPDDVRVDLWDEGIHFDPFHDAPQADTGSALEEREVGGLGVFIVTTLADETGYRREGNRNHVWLVKRRVASG